MFQAIVALKAVSARECVMRRLTAAAVVFSICPGLVAGPVLAAGGDPIGATLSVVHIVTAAYNRDTVSPRSQPETVCARTNSSM